MSASRTISNPAGAGGASVTDWRTGKTILGGDVDLDCDYIYVRANATVSRGQAVGLVIPTASVPPSCTPQAAASAKRLYLGAAMTGAAAGQYLQIAVAGFALAFVGSSTPAAGDLLLVPATTTGQFDTTAVAPDATTVVGTIAGAVLGTKGTDNLAFVFLSGK